MRLLLDTHCWLWMLAAPSELSPETRKVLEDPANDLLLSAASSWEIGIKHALGRLPLPEPPRDYVPARIRASGVTALPIEHSHALRAAELPPHHRDPFDRLLVAQSQMERAPILTVDRQLSLYDVEVVWAA